MKSLNTCLLSFLFIISLHSQSGSSLFDNSLVHDIHLEISTPNFWDTLLFNYEQIEQNEDRIYIPASVTIDSTSLDSVGIRIKGFFSASTNGKKKPLKIDFNEYLPEQEYEGLKKLNLQNSFEDPSSMRDMLAYNIFNTEGIHASKSAYARVYINGEYWGLYLMVEQIDKTFLEERFGDDSGNLYKSMSNGHLVYNGSSNDSYTEYIGLKTNETENDWSRFIDFVEVLNRIYLKSNKEYITEIANIFNVNTYLKILAIDILLLNWDSYYAHGRNFYIYDNPVQQKFEWIPWDYNLAFSDSYIDILVTDTWGESIPLIENLLDRPVFLQAYVNAYSEILEDNFTADRLFPIIDSTEKLISESLAADSNKFFDYRIFKASLVKDTMANYTEKWITKVDINNVFFIQPNTPMEQIDSAFMAGAHVFDTNNANHMDISIDTVIINSDTTINVIIVDKWEVEKNIIGLKPFIDRRISEVAREIASVVIPDETSYFTLMDKSYLMVYPNPADNFIILSGLNTANPFEIEITDISGKTVLNAKNQEIIYLDYLPAGIFFITVHSNEGTQVRKFLKR